MFVSVRVIVMCSVIVVVVVCVATLMVWVVVVWVVVVVLLVFVVVCVYDDGCDDVWCVDGVVGCVVDCGVMCVLRVCHVLVGYACVDCGCVCGCIFCLCMNDMPWCGDDCVVVASCVVVVVVVLLVYVVLVHVCVSVGS